MTASDIVLEIVRLLAAPSPAMIAARVIVRLYIDALARSLRPILRRSADAVLLWWGERGE